MKPYLCLIRSRPRSRGGWQYRTARSRVTSGVNAALMAFYEASCRYPHREVEVMAVFRLVPYDLEWTRPN